MRKICNLRIIVLGFLLQNGLAEDFPVTFNAVHKAILAAQLPGPLKSFRKVEGDTVKENDTIVVIENSEMKLQLQRIQLSLEFQNKQLVALEQRLKLEHQARKITTGTELEIEKLKTDIAVQNIDLQVWQDRIDRSVIKAPFPGKIVRQNVRSHEWVAPGQPVVELAGFNLDAEILIPAKLMLYLEGNARRKVHKILVEDIKESIGVILICLAPEVDRASNTIKTTWRVVETASLLRGGMRGVIHFDDLPTEKTLARQEDNK